LKLRQHPGDLEGLCHQAAKTTGQVTSLNEEITRYYKYIHHFTPQNLLIDIRFDPFTDSFTALE
jgi:hypothetical protein